MAADLLGRRVVSNVVEVFRRLAVLLFYLPLRLLGPRRIEFILRAAIEIDLLLTALDSLEEKNRPRDEKHRDDEYRNAARNGFALVFGPVFEIVYCLLNNHRQNVARST